MRVAVRQRSQHIADDAQLLIQRQRFHQQFGRAAASPADVPREVPCHLDEGLSWEEARVAPGDWPVACGGKRYQLDRQPEAMSRWGTR